MSRAHRRWRKVAWRVPDRFVWLNGQPYPVLAGGGGGRTTTTTVVQPAPKSEEELALLRQQNQLISLQVEEVRRQNEAMAAVFPQQKALLEAQIRTAQTLAEASAREVKRLERIAEAQVPLMEEQVAIARAQLPFIAEQTAIARRAGALQEKLIERTLAELEGTPAEQEIRRLSNERALAILRGEPIPLSPEQERQLDELFGRAREEGQTSLRRFAEELAAGRGLRLADTPAAQVALEQERELEKSLAAARTAASLNLGTAREAFAESVRQFQENLRQQAFQNRLALTGQSVPFVNVQPVGIPLPAQGAPIFATGLAGQTAGLITPLLNVLKAPATEIETKAFRPGGVDILQGVAGGLGTLAFGLGSLFKSSARFKRDIEPLDVDEYERALRKVRETPVVRFRYKDESPRSPKRLGIVIETSPPEVTRDGLTLDMPSYTGLVLAGLKGLDRRVDRVERGLHGLGRRAA